MRNPWPFMFGVALCAAMTLSCHTGLSPLDPSWDWRWERSGGGPVFTKLTTAVEDNGIGSPDVCLDPAPAAPGRFVMAYAQGGTDRHGRIGLARSADGAAWTRVAPDGAASVLEPAAGAWDGWFLDTPALLERNGVWHLWYFGDADNEAPGGAIGLATSADGVHFTRASAAPVLAPGPAGSWDALWVESPDVVYDGTRFVMYYTGVDATWRPRVGRATSADGIAWTKDPANPVLDHGPAGSWDGFAAAVPGVALKDGEWSLFYAGLGEAEAALGLRTPRIGFAWSADGIRFTKYDQNPLVDAGLVGLESDGPYNPCALFDPAARRWMLWLETGRGFSLATAPEIPGR